MRKKYLILIILTISIFQFGCDLASLGNDNVGTSYVKGTVFDADAKIRLTDVSVSINLRDETIKTDDNGYFYILNIEMGNNFQDINVIANKTDYETAIITTTLRVGDTAVVNIPMFHK